MIPPPPPPRRSLGQNFLVSHDATRRIVAALDVGAGDVVLEIGPGRGALTRPLLATGARVVAVETDAALAARLREAAWPGLEVIESDVLRVDLAELAEAHDVPDRAWPVAGNLPYNISKPIAMQLVRQRRSVARAVLMFQREVAQRLTAPPGGKRYAPLTVLAGAAYTIKPLFELGPGAFRPRPKVVSSVTRWRTRTDGPDDATLDRLARCLRACFASRRRTVWNNLRRSLGEPIAERTLADAGVDGALRAERLAPDELMRLADAWPDDRTGRP